MYQEGSSCDDDHVFSLEPVPSSRSRPFQAKSMGFCAVALALVVLGGQSMRNRSRAPSRVTDEIGLDLEETKIRIPVDILGIHYSGYSNAAPGVMPTTRLGDELTPQLRAGGNSEKDLFKQAIRYAVIKKGKIDQSQVTIEDADIVSSPTRTELDIVVTVPDELSAEALVNRLNDDGDLRKMMKENLKTHGSFTTQQVVVHIAAMEQSVTKKGVFETDITPLIVLELDVRGIDYKILASDTSLKEAFVTALQSGIAQENIANAKSIALDIADGDKNGGVPFVHVTAKFEVPSGMKADPSMSEWPQGVEGIGSAVQTNIRNLADIDVASKDGFGGQHVISVFPGAFHLGAVRQTFDTQVRAEFEVAGLNHNTEANHVRPDVVKNKIVELVKEQVGKDKQVEAVYLPLGDTEADSQAAATIRVQVQLSAQDAEASQKATDWQAKLLPAGDAVQTHFKTKNSAATTANYKVMVGVPKVDQRAETVDVDVVAHGIDYAHITDTTKGAFLSDLSKVVRESVTTYTGRPAYLPTVKDDIDVTVASSKAYTNAVNVRIHIPAPAAAHDVGVLIGNLEDTMTALTDELEENLEAMDGIKYVSSWTSSAIEVTVPGTDIS